MHTFGDAKGRPVGFRLTGGNVSDYVGYEMLSGMANWEIECLVGDRGYDSNKIRSSLEERDIQPCIPWRHNRKTEIEYDRELYKTRHRIEKRLCETQGLETHRNAPPQMPEDISRSDRPCRHRRILVVRRFNESRPWGLDETGYRRKPAVGGAVISPTTQRR